MAYNDDYIYVGDALEYVIEHELLQFDDIEAWLFEEIKYIKNPPSNSKSEDWKKRATKLMKLLRFMIETLKPTITYAEFKLEPSDEMVLKAILE